MGKSFVCLSLPPLTPAPRACYPLPRARVIPFRTPLMAWFGILFQFIGLSTLSESFFFFSGRPGANAGTAIGYHHHHPRSRQ